MNFGFTRKGPDHIAEEVARVLSKRAAFEFKALFLEVYANLKARNAAGGGEEMLRLRAYDKLQTLVASGVVKKQGKEYRGVPSAITSFFKAAAEFNAKGTSTAPPVKVSNGKKAVGPAVARPQTRSRRIGAAARK